MDEVATVFNSLNDQLALYTSEVTRVAREVGTEGKLGGQAQMPGLEGTWKDLADSVNSMSGNITGQVRDVARVATAVAKGDLSQKITVDVNGEMLELKETLNTMVDELSAFADEVTKMAREVGTEGRLGGQALVPGVGGTWRDLADSVNLMAENLTGQVRDVARVATAVAKGDLSQKMTVDVKGEMLELKDTLNTMVDQLSLFADEVTDLAREVGTEGHLGGQARVRGVFGTWEDLTTNVNVMASNLTTQVRSIAQVATAVARGDLSHRITVDAKGEVAALAQSINEMVDTLTVFAVEVTRVAHEVGTEGRLGGQAMVPHVAGTWKDLTENVNSMATNLTNQVRNIAQVTTAVAQGDLSKKIDVDARGEILELKTTINTMVDQLSSFAAEVTRVAREVGREGRLGGQAQVEGVSGTWKRLTENVNELAGNLTLQVRAIAEVTGAVATGDLSRSISVAARGEVADLKDNVNTMVRSLRETTIANQEQEWLQTNLARMASSIQGQRDLGAVAELIMDELIPLVEAQHGMFFLADTSGREATLRLIASYGLPASVNATSQFALGQSLIGQAAKSKKPIVVTNLPADYVKVSSGLGQAAPVNLMVQPIVVENQVLGVIEAGSFNRFSGVQREFMEQLMEIIGANVQAIMANSRTDALLAESQRLAAELQASTGELQARQEELQRSNADLEDKAALLARQNRDIELKNVEIEHARQELEERARELDQASRYKSQFLANMSHELRTPLNSLLILARLLADNPDRNLSAKQVEYANVIYSSGSDLLQLINDILDLSRVEAGKLELHPERFEVRDLVDDLRTVFAPLTSDKGLRFIVSRIPPQVPRELFTDRQRLRQILHNLLANAVKFTDHGQVELQITATSAHAGPGPGLAFAVSDTGIGINEHNLATIFGAFQQADGTTSRRYGGTGLGLAICQELAGQLGGRVTATSVPGEGSTFTLYLPKELPPAAELVAPARTETQAAAEADPDVSQSAGIGAGPVAAGGALLAAASDSHQEATPGSLQEATPDSSLEATPDSSLEATPDGVQETAPDGLREAIADGARETPPDGGAAYLTDAAPPGLSGKKVLVVDDDQRNAFAITSILELYGLTVLHAADGASAMSLLRTESDIDIVLMDLMLPELDGYATTTAIRQLPGFEQLPIIAVTARAMQDDLDKSIRAGANDYVTKPVDTHELLACIERSLGLTGGR